MRKVALAVALAATALSGCISTTTSPAPLAKTVIDDRGIRYAFLSLDALASLADAGIKSGFLTPGSAKANAIADGLVKVQGFLNAASHAQRAGSLTDYRAAFDQAQAAMLEVKKALGKKTSLNQPSHDFKSVQATVTQLRAA